MVNDDDFHMLATRHRHGAAWRELGIDDFDPVPLTELPVDWVAVRYWVEVIALTVLAGAFVWQVVA